MGGRGELWLLPLEPEVRHGLGNNAAGAERRRMQQQEDEQD